MTVVWVNGYSRLAIKLIRVVDDIGGVGGDEDEDEDDGTGDAEER